jgi:hypothetical protein
MVAPEPTAPATADVTVFRAPRPRRTVAVVGILVLLILDVRVTVAYGWLAIIGVLLVLGVAVQLWWSVLRPRLVAKLDGVEVVSGWRPTRFEWREIQRTEVGPQGTLIVLRGGREVFSRYPQGPRSTSDTAPRTDADWAAAFLAARAAWGRRRDGSPPPRYHGPSA